MKHYGSPDGRGDGAPEPDHHRHGTTPEAETEPKPVSHSTARQGARPTPARTEAARAGVRSAIEQATRGYLAGEQLDMSALATSLGIGRATLYRWVGSREQLLATVLAETTVSTFAEARRRGKGIGVELVVDTCDIFIGLALGARPMRAFAAREPLLCLRLATAPGAVEQASAEGVRDLLEQELSAGNLTLAAPAPVLAEAIVRVCDSHIYGYLLGRGTAMIDTTLLIRLLLR